MYLEQRAARSFRSARKRFKFDPNVSLEDNVKNLSRGLSVLSQGLEEIRNQNGALTSLALTNVLLSERK